MITDDLVLGDASYPALWLRDNCPCAECAVAGSGQKLFGITDLPADTRIASAEVGGESVRVVFAPDPHESHFPLSWLEAHRPGRALPHDDRAEDAKRLWRAADLAGHVLSYAWTSFADDPEDGLGALLSLGFVLLRGVPIREGAVTEVARSFGFVRETNYGTVFDVRTTADAANLAFTSLPISPHTDNPYREPVPTLQLLHCLADASVGGGSGLVDGFHAAAALRRELPAAYETLTRTPVTFRYADAHADLTATAPLIGLDPLGRIRQVRFNNRSMRPVALPAAGFYAAYRAFAERLYDPAARLEFRLNPGDCVVFDNTRVLHSRGSFSGGGRHLQGCYADLDAAASTLAVLRRGRTP